MNELELLVFLRKALEEKLSHPPSEDELFEKEYEEILRPSALRTVRQPGLRYFVEGYFGILDDHDCDVTSYYDVDLQEKLTEVSGIWFAFPSEQAAGFASALSEVEISEEDMENYFGGQVEEVEEDIQKLHKILQQTLGGLGPEQVLIFRGDHL